MLYHYCYCYCYYYVYVYDYMIVNINYIAKVSTPSKQTPIGLLLRSNREYQDDEKINKYMGVFDKVI